MQAAIKVVVKKDIGAWRSGFAAADTLESLRLELVELKSLNSLESVESYSKRLDELKELTGSLPTGKHRTDLVIQASELEKRFMGIQDEVITQQIKDRFAEAQSKINLLPGCRDEREKLRLLEKADTSLHSASSMLEQQKSGASEGNLEQLRLLSEQVGEHKKTLQATASKMQPPVQGQGMELVTSIDELIAEADNRLCGAEKMRKAVAGAALNQTHMDEIEGILDQVSEKILQVKGSDHRADRDRLQTMNATLLSRWTQLQGGGANNGQSTAASTHTATGNQNQTAVNEIRTALDEAEAPIEALTSNPNSPNKKDLHTQAKGCIEKATLMLGNLTDPALKPQRADLNARLTDLTARLEVLELDANQGQRLKESRAPQPQREPRESGLEQAGAAVGQSLQHYQGRLSEAAARNTLGSLSGVLSKLAAGDNPVSAHVPIHSPVGHSVTQAVTTPSMLAPKVPLTALAAGLKLQQSDFYKDRFVEASISVEPSKNTGKIIPIQVSVEVPFFELSEHLQHRMTQACKGVQPERVLFTQVTLIADHQKVFDGASFKIALNTIIGSKYGQCFKSSSGRQYSPIGTSVSLPQALEAGSSFYQTDWSAHEKGVPKDETYFAFEQGKSGYKHDIGFALLANIIKAAGGSDELASSDEAGIIIPYGVQVRRQSDDIINQIERPERMGSRVRSDSAGGWQRDGGYTSRGLRLPTSDLQSDGVGESCEESDGPSDSGIVPMALEKETSYTTSRCISGREVLVHKPGLLLVRTATGMDMKNNAELQDWIYGKTLDPKDLNKIAVL